MSASWSGEAGNGPSTSPRMSASAEALLFRSEADNLVGGDNNGVSDIFLTHRSLWQTRRISLDLDGFESSAAAEHPALDATGTQMLYDRLDDAGYSQVYSYDPHTLQKDRVSLAQDSDGLILHNHHPAISPDGRYIAYLETTQRSSESAATCNVHIFDQQSDVYQRLACPQALIEDSRYTPYFSEDGAYIDWVKQGIGPDGRVKTGWVLENPFCSP